MLLKRLLACTMVVMGCTTLSGCQFLPFLGGSENAENAEEAGEAGGEEGADEGGGDEAQKLFEDLKPKPRIQNYRPVSTVVSGGIKLHGTLYVPGMSPYQTPTAGEEEAAEPAEPEAGNAEGAGHDDKAAAKAPAIKPAKVQYPLVILLHMLSGDRWEWKDLPRHLVEQGYAVLTVDLRGHGESVYRGKQLKVWRSFDKTDWQKMPDDITQLVATIAKKPEFNMVNTAKQSVLGASIGANVGVVYSAKNKAKVKALVLLSPGLEYHGITTLQPLMDYEDALYVAASKQDAYAAESSDKLYKYALGKKKIKIFEDIGHGSDMLESNPDLGKDIMGWLKGIVPTPGPGKVILATETPGKPAPAENAPPDAATQNPEKGTPPAEPKPGETESAKPEEKTDKAAPDAKKPSDTKPPEKPSTKPAGEKPSAKPDTAKASDKPKPAVKETGSKPTSGSGKPTPPAKPADTSKSTAAPATKPSSKDPHNQDLIHEALEKTKTPIPKPSAEPKPEKPSASVPPPPPPPAPPPSTPTQPL